MSILQIDFRTKNNVCPGWQPRQAFFPPSINQLRGGNTEYLPYRAEILCYRAKYSNPQGQFRVLMNHLKLPDPLEIDPGTRLESVDLLLHPGTGNKTGSNQNYPDPEPLCGGIALLI